jgi:hypothetical protein
VQETGDGEKDEISKDKERSKKIQLEKKTDDER